ncbi:MAG TPA: hypothetical protein VLA88_04780 [Candidatus Saccharimonadales bacterium]|nr:hypothetical protein [Candidatus Saccharimonadales bacterium]
MEETPDITTAPGWQAALKALADRVEHLGRYTRVDVIADAMRALAEEGLDAQFREGGDFGVFIVCQNGNEPVIQVELTTMSSGERLAEALKRLDSPLITAIKVEPGAMTRFGCEIFFVAQPAGLTGRDT